MTIWLKKVWKWLRWLLLLLFISPFLLISWFSFIQPFVYKMTFGPHAAEALLARAGFSDAKVRRVLQHEGQPEIWMDGIEKFSVELVDPFFGETSHVQLKTNVRGDIKAPGIWFKGDNPDPILQSAIQAADRCAKSTFMGTKPILLDQEPARMLYSFRYFNQRDSVTVLVLSTHVQGDVLTYLHCNY